MFTISDLPKGKYIVCGEAMTLDEEKIIQSNCFETMIDKNNNLGLYSILSFVIY